MRTLLLLLVPVLLLPVAPAGAAPGETASRTFDVAALLDERTEAPIERIGVGDPSWLPWRDAEAPESVRVLTQDRLEEIVTTFLGPDAWFGENAGVEWTADGRLRVTAAPAVIDAAAALIEDLFLEASRRVRVRADLLTFDEAGAARLGEAGLLDALAAGRLDGAGREAVLAAAARPGSSFVTGDVLTRPGCLAPFGRTGSRSYVADFDVEIAQGSVVGDPVVGFAKDGFLLRVRPFVLADGSFFLEALSQTAAFDGPIRMLNPETEPLGTIGMPAMRRERFLTSGRVAAGETLAAVRRGGEGPGALSVLLLTPDLVGPAPRDPAVRRVPAALLTTRPLSARAGWFLSAQGESGEEPAPFPITPREAPPFLVDRLAPSFDDDALAALAEEIASAAVPGPGDVWVASADGAASLGQAVAAAEAPLARSFRVKLRIRAGDRRIDLDLDVPAGRDAFYETGLVRAFLADWEVEVAQEARIGDPVVGHAFGGLVANFRLNPAPDGGAAAGHVSIALVDLAPEFETLRPGNEKTGIVEVPRTRQVLLAQDVALVPGKPETLHEGDAAGLGPVSITMEIEAR